MGAIAWTPKARDDFEAAIRYIARDSPRLASSFSARIEVAVGRLTIFPRSGRIVPEFEQPDIRELIVQSYRIVYRLRGDDVEILTVHHGARLLKADDQSV
jgi:addiction module RelE/StbE family toxin